MKNESDIIIYNTDDGKSDVRLYARDGVIWMNQAQMALLFETSKQNISLHIQNVLQEGELQEVSVVKDYLTTAADGKKYNVTYYALPILKINGVAHKTMETEVESIYLDFDARRKKHEAELADQQDEEELKRLEEIEKDVKNRPKNDDEIDL